MLKNFVKDIKENSKVAIYGAGTLGLKIKKYLEENRPDIKPLFFIDSAKTGEQEGLKIIGLTDLDKYKGKLDLIVGSVYYAASDLSDIFEFLNIPSIFITREQYFRCFYEECNDIQKAACEVFAAQEDKNLYNLIWEKRKGACSRPVEDYVYDRYGIHKFHPVRNYTKQYGEYICKDSIKTIIDGGFCNGIHIFSFLKNFKNLQKVYSFEPMYETFKNSNYDYYIKQIDAVEIIPFGLWDKKDELSFVETTTNISGSHVKLTKETRQLQKTDNVTTIKVISIDEIKKEKNIDKIDFIKMDIEGSELQALKGAKETLKNDRPQLAISIYHSTNDFINLPLYLKNELENYEFRLGHYSHDIWETVIFAIPKELKK